MTNTALAEVRSDRVAIEPATRPQRFGVHVVPGGVDVVVHAPKATVLYICFFDQDDAEHRVRLLPGLHGVWTAHVPGVEAGVRYGLRAAGAWDRSTGQAFNPHKLLLDPYARGIVGEFANSPETYPTSDGDIDTRDSAPFVPRGVVLAPVPQIPIDAPSRPNTEWAQTVIYEAHVRGLTKQMQAVPEELRGTYAGAAHPAAIAHLHRLGITALELLPIQAKATEPSLIDRGLTNYWGYNTLGFFAPEPSYATAAARAQGPAAVLDEVRGMVHLLHEAGIEVLLDVVYNHTCEGGPQGPMLSLRGLDDGGYYLNPDGDDGAYYDVTGTGNSLDFRNPRVIQLALDSLRYWVVDVGVDGFRFDLAVTLGRRGTRFSPAHPFLVALTTDPVLSHTKLIAEPWDVGPNGWQTGAFPSPMAEWNDRFRDSLRNFWVADRGSLTGGGPAGDLRDLATRLAGSADTFGHSALQRGPTASINFITAHDGFTLADLVAYDHKHNEANGENGQDGTDNNRSWNHGVEGPTDDEQILSDRARTQRNLFGTLLVAAGVPMLTAGDEFGRSQSGNNNVYCHDNELAWIDWSGLEHGGIGFGTAADLVDTVTHLLHLRSTYPALRPARYRVITASGRPTLAWFNREGADMDWDGWHDTTTRVLQMVRATPIPGDAEILILINGGLESQAVTSPTTAQGYSLVWDSVWDRPELNLPEELTRLGPGATVQVPGMSMRIYVST